MKTIEDLEGEIEFLKKDSGEIKKRLFLIEERLAAPIKKEEPSQVKFSADDVITSEKIELINKKDKQTGLTRQGSWILIISGGLLCLTGAGIVFGFPLLIWGIIALSKVNKKNDSYNSPSNLDLNLKEEVSDYKTKNIAAVNIATTSDLVKKENNLNSNILINEEIFTEKKSEKLASPIKIKSAESLEFNDNKPFSLEEEIGMKWFSRIGILALVVGVGFFIKYAIDMDWINHLARIILGLILGISLIVFGEIFAKNKGYAKWAKTLTGGGIAITYFCVYAAYYFESYRQAIGINQFLDLFLMIAVILVAVALSLRDNSQIIAAESFFLGYVTALLNDNFELTTIFYTLLLTAGLVAVASYKKWPAIGLGGVVASYLMYILWNANNQETFFYAAVILSFYFISFALQSFFFSKRENLEIDNVLITLINSSLFFVLFYVEIKKFYPDFCSLLTLVLAIIHLAGFVFYKKLNVQKLSKTHSYLALFFITLTVPIYFNPELVTIIWALEALILAIIYFKTSSPVLNIAFNLLSLFLFIKSITYDLVSLEEMNLDNFFQSTRLISFGATIICFYLIYGIILRNKNLIQNFRMEVASLYSWAASSLLVLIVFVEFGKNYPAWTTFILAVLLAIFIFVGNKMKSWEFFYQANTLAVIVFCKLLFYDSLNLAPFNPENILDSSRLGVFLAVGIIFYGAYAYFKKSALLQEGRNIISTTYSWAASSLLVLIVFVEFGKNYPAWTTIMVASLLAIFIFAGDKMKSWEFYYQAVILTVIVFIKLLFFDSLNLNPFDPENILSSARLGVFLAVSGVFYGAYVYLKKFATDLLEEKNKIAIVYSWLAMSLVLLVIFMEFNGNYPARASMGLALLMLVYFLVSKLSIKELLYQAVVISQILFVKVLFFDAMILKELKMSQSFLDSRFIVFLLVALFFYLISIYIDNYKEKIEMANRAITKIYSYYGSFLIFLLIMLEMKDYWISVGWSIFALVLISMGFMLSRKSLRIQGIIIFTISIFKVFIYDIQGLEVIYRTVSYIVLGIILLMVSFIYNKYKDKLKEII